LLRKLPIQLLFAEYTDENSFWHIVHDFCLDSRNIHCICSKRRISSGTYI